MADQEAPSQEAESDLNQSQKRRILQTTWRDPDAEARKKKKQRAVNKKAKADDATREASGQLESEVVCHIHFAMCGRS